MDDGKIDFSAISDEGVTWTLLGTLYLRAYESRLPRPILGDRHAAEALSRIDYDFAKLRRRLHPNGNQFLVALRAKVLDDWCTDFLTRTPDATVLQLGCGLDSRMLRLDAEGAHPWYDLDIPAVIDLRRRLYPEKGNHQMIGASVTDTGWLDKVPGDRPVLIVAEGLFPYLTADQMRRLLPRLTAHFDTGELLFDGLAPSMVRMGRLFQWPVRDGHEVERMDPRLTLAGQVPITDLGHLIPVRTYRLLYQFMHAVPPLRRLLVDYRFTF
ncbi:class I SAM-dependent methyltransferase [Actinomadura oligospora]|uniref:class I SAM-dependent methyltransferase n=1 Tax=Actinomadura oligospora TaxID=111804 RepID=UPI0004B134DF|nr:class I SAM-dependent methyltransferase [Actinomadura oligospora]